MDSASRQNPLNANKHYGDDLLPQKRVAAMLSVSPRALEAWRMRGDGPPFFRISKRCVRYRRHDVEAWLASRRAGTSYATPTLLAS